MSQTIMKLMLKGGILPWESKHLTDKAYKKLSNQISVEHEYFKQFISKEDSRRFNQYNALIVEQLSLESDVTDYEMLMLGISVGLEIAEHKQCLIASKRGD